ncbi:hypothetical protein EHS86_05875 [Erwinia amylovora]|uniref:Uncharacterized protein n=1 Tax=Erwinia amylovora NBRC 12687 = CFBP 1232 TaxID=1219359 RepID=A0A831A4I5_ERWAM|nr:hypothetical protein AD997_17100 [Erwinia amylovora]EKV52192.1 hypothetical protein EaACW_3581 [Erwinia amylovora ACW56400]CCO91774.1 hypothetical protein BN435_3633 [Erwinia amylovora 01SFR-BO]CCO95568.1 hypothetical protein BN437_3669 [Erwinia amylovora NBRC 12687 = CFBP 1232]CCP00888.1 hypothetical protein BN438_3634 [Erwinia amylovora UPN527]
MPLLCRPQATCLHHNRGKSDFSPGSLQGIKWVTLDAKGKNKREPGQPEGCLEYLCCSLK